MTQADLFDKQAQKEPICTLTEPDAKTLTYLSGVLDLHYRVTELKQSFKCLNSSCPIASLRESNARQMRKSSSS